MSMLDFVLEQPHLQFVVATGEDFGRCGDAVGDAKNNATRFRAAVAVMKACPAFIHLKMRKSQH